MSIKSAIRSHVPPSWINERNRIRDSKRIKASVSVLPKRVSDGRARGGIRFFADTESGTGLSNGAAMLWDMLETSDVESIHIEINKNGECIIPDEEQFKDDSWLINLFVVQPPVWPIVSSKLSSEVFDGKINIGFWLWETPEIPEEWIPLCAWFDEIWTPSSFVTDAVRKVSDRPVRTLRFGLNPAKAESVSENDRLQLREKYNIAADALVHLVMFDGRSGFERKNPEGAIKAYTMAYPVEKENTWLIVKAKCADKKQMKLLRSLLKDYKNVVWIEELMSRHETDALIASSDILLSLHRAEGFGLPIAEAMQLGCVAVATDYSSTTEFVSDDGAVAIPCTLTKISHDVTAYRKGTVWAEPDIEAAAEAIKHLGENEEYRITKGQRAKTAVYEKLSFEEGARLFEEYERELNENHCKTT